MAKGKKAARKPDKALDIVSGKRGRGRPGVRTSEIAGRSYHYRLLFGQIWNWVGEKLVQAKTEEEVIKAFEPSEYYKQEFLGVTSLILRIIRDPQFPKRSQTQINFLADSLAARGTVSPRRSRDICGEERAKERAKSKHHIIRKEFYIECSCGYKGPARDNACRKCGAEIPPSLERWFR